MLILVLEKLKRFR